MSINLTKMLKDFIELPRHLLHAIFYLLFILSLYCITKPLAMIVDYLSNDDDIKFIEEDQ